MRHRRGLRRLRVAFTGDHLTRFGGAFLLHLFFQRLRLRQRLTDEVRFPQRNNAYSIAEMLLALLYPIILGLERIETTELLQHNGVFQTLTGLPTYPNPTSLRRFLRRFAVRGLPKLCRLHDRVLAQMCQRPRRLRRVLFDLDSTVLTLYGHQEKARRGYNPRKRGRPSYHPLVCFEGQTRDFWHGELRPGDIHTATGAVWLLRACIAKVPATVRQIRVRADAGFFDYKIVRTIEERRGKFVIVARLTPPLKRLVTGLGYTEVGRDLAMAECPYQPHGWPRPYRFVVVRKTLPEEETPQTTLFTSGRYSYHAFVTNLRIWPLAVYRFYNDRAAVEPAGGPSSRAAQKSLLSLEAPSLCLSYELRLYLYSYQLAATCSAGGHASAATPHAYLTHACPLVEPAAGWSSEPERNTSQPLMGSASHSGEDGNATVYTIDP